MTPSGAEMSPAGRSCRWRRSEIQILCVQRRDLERKPVPGKKWYVHQMRHYMACDFVRVSRLRSPSQPMHLSIPNLLISSCQSADPSPRASPASSS